MPITANGTTYSDDQIKSFFASNPDASSVAKQAASMGLNEGQIKQASDIAGKGWSDSDINNFASSNGYNWGGGGALQTVPTGSGVSAGGMNINGTSYTAQQIKDFYASGGDDRQFVQQHGVTDLDQQRQLMLQGRQIAGNYATGDAGLQQAYKSYQKTNPSGAWTNSYAGWLNDVKSNPAMYNALVTGQYTGAATAGADFAPGGIYGPGTGHDFNYQQSGQGRLGIGDGWGSGGIIANATGGTGGTSGGVVPGTGGSATVTVTGGATGAGAGGATVPWNVTQDQTVEGRINGIIGGNSGIIQQARAGALENMNSRGLVNSSIAQTASDAAAYQAAIPIAQADAATASKAAGYNADIQNQFSTNALNRTASMDQAKLSADAQKAVAQLNADTQKTITGLNNAEQLQAQQFSLANATLLNTNTQAAQAYNNAMAVISAIQNNAGMTADAKTQAIANVWKSVQMQTQTIGNIAGVNVNSRAAFAHMPGFNENGDWVGFDTTSATSTTTESPKIAPPAPPDNFGGGAGAGS